MMQNEIDKISIDVYRYSTKQYNYIGYIPLQMLQSSYRIKWTIAIEKN